MWPESESWPREGRLFAGTASSLPRLVILRSRPGFLRQTACNSILMTASSFLYILYAVSTIQDVSSQGGAIKCLPIPQAADRQTPRAEQGASWGIGIQGSSLNRPS